MKLESFPRVDLLFGPSPVHRLDRLTAELGGATVWAKRDDVCSGLAFGGNKTRKLEYLAADALAQGCDTLVSIGGVQSNHTRQVAAVAARLGLACVLVQESWVDWPDAVYDRVGNIQLSRILGADVRLVEAGFGIGFKESWEAALADVEARGGKPYAIPAGASDHPLGGLGYARWAGEVAEQERELGVFFDTVVVCSVTGSTQAGMVVGFAAQEQERRVLGIDGSAKPAETLAQVSRIARATAELVELGRELRDDELVLDDRYHAGTYGIPDAQTLAAIRTAGRLEGMITDPVYEGKSMAGLIELVRRGELPAGSNVLYAHLGGQPALSGYSALFPVMRIAVIGASGWLGGAVAREALARGHEVTAIGRHENTLRAVEGAQIAVADVAEPESLRQAVAGHDAVVSAVTDRSTADRSIIPRTARTLLQVLPAAGVSRLLVVGGGGSLEVEPGVRAIDLPGFPGQYRAEAEAQAEALEIYRTADTTVDWTYLSPPPHHLVPGEKTGSYRVLAGDAPVVDEHGESRITSGDFASALVDELENGQFVRERFTAAS